MIQEFIGTGYVLNRAHTKILLIHHKKFDKWLPPGGHCDTNEAPHEAAIREVFEETGIKATFVIEEKVVLNLKNELEEEVPVPAFVLKELIEGKYTRKEDHIHIDFIYIMEADELSLKLSEREVHAAGWFDKDEIQKLPTFPGVVKIVDKILK